VRRGGVEVKAAHRITGIDKADRFAVSTDHGAFHHGIAGVGDRWALDPKMGATGFAHDVARRFGLALTRRRPALVPLTLPVPELSGVSLEWWRAWAARTSARPCCSPSRPGRDRRPADSSYWQQGQEIVIDLLPVGDADASWKERKRTRPKAELRRC